MSAELQEIGHYYLACDPFYPLESDDPRYIDLNADQGVRSDDVLSPTGFLERALLLHALGGARRPSCQLFSGFTGSGKTTELKRLAARLERLSEPRIKVIYIDAEDHLNLYVPVRIEHVLTAIAMEVDKAACRLSGRDEKSDTGFLARFWAFLTRTEGRRRKVSWTG